MSKEKYQEAFEALQKYGSQTKAADKLGIARSTFKKRLDRYYSDIDEATLYRNCANTRTPIDDVSYYWVKTDEVSMMVRRNSNQQPYEEIRDSLIAEMQKHAVDYEKIIKSSNETSFDENVYSMNSHLLVVDPADIHIGKLSKIYETGFEYNMDIAVNRVKEGIDSIILKSEGFNIDKIVFVIGNDVLHIDSPYRKTTAGTPQDTDGQWWQMFLEAKKCYVSAIEKLTELAPVHVVFCPSNHDYVSGWMLADTIYSWFSKHPNVSFGIDQKNISIAHRKYVQFGSNLIGFTHGDGAKEKDLPSLMQYEAREAWGNSKFAYWYVHHTHHKNRSTIGLNHQKLEKDHIGVTVLQTGKNLDSNNNVYVETVRTPSPSDGWHDRNGYVNQQAIEAFLHHPQYGQVARFTHWF